MTLSSLTSRDYSRIDRLIAKGVTVRLTDTHGVSAPVTLVSRDRQRIEYRDATGHVGLLHRDDINALEEITS